MSTNSTANSPKKELAEIKKKLRGFEEKLLKSKNDLEIYLIIQDMVIMVRDEVCKWIDLITENGVVVNNLPVDFEMEAKKSISELQELDELFTYQLAEYFESAVIIQNVMMREHQIQNELITIRPE